MTRNDDARKPPTGKPVKEIVRRAHVRTMSTGPDSTRRQVLVPETRVPVKDASEGGKST
jgi:hypothetical protein